MKLHFKLTEFQVKNLIEAVNFMADLPENTLMPGLTRWRNHPNTCGTPSCNSPACFGGWLPYAPYFKKLGVKRGKLGHAPIYQGRGGFTVAKELFGTSWMFAPTGCFFDKDAKINTGALPEKSIILLRLAYILENFTLLNEEGHAIS